MSPWIRTDPTTIPVNLPIGCIPIQHHGLGHIVAWVEPHLRSGETERVARLAQQAPALHVCLRRLVDLASALPADRNEIALANAVREARQAMQGLEALS